MAYSSSYVDGAGNWIHILFVGDAEKAYPVGGLVYDGSIEAKDFDNPPEGACAMSAEECLKFLKRNRYGW